MSSDRAVEVRGLGKRYHIGTRRPQYGTLRDRLTGLASSAMRRVARADAAAESESILWALKDISFDVRRGEVLGVVGGNGAGKSTLLKVLSRITEPTEGEALLYGRVGSLLEVGTGFHPELTGRENIFLNGAILGMSRAEVTRKFDAIVDFAGVARFIDTAVRFYSSGMYVRLAFAVAAHMEPEILVVDEVLAVGDAEFQKRCLGRMNDISREGRTILFVSHNLEAVQRLCTRGVLLKRGRLEAVGPIADVVAAYRSGDQGDDELGRFNPASRRGTGWARFTDVRLMRGTARIGRCHADEDLCLEMDLKMVDAGAGSLRGLLVEIVVTADDGQALCSVMNVDRDGSALPDANACTLRLRLPGPTFVPGLYRIRAFVGIPFLQHVDEIDDALEFEILPPREPWRPYELYPHRGRVCRLGEWTTEVAAVQPAAISAAPHGR